MVEVLVVTALLGLMLVFAAGFYEGALRGLEQGQAVSEARQNLLVAGDRLVRDARSALDVTVDDEAITFTLWDGRQVRYAVVENTIVRSVDGGEGVVVGYDISSLSVEVSPRGVVTVFLRSEDSSGGVHEVRTKVAMRNRE